MDILSFQAIAYKTSKLYASDIVQKSYLATYAQHSPKDLDKVLEPFKALHEGREQLKNDGKAFMSRFSKGLNGNG